MLFGHRVNWCGLAVLKGRCLVAEPRVVRVVHFVVESLEEIASKIPASGKAQADTLRESARIMRESNNPKTVRIWEVPDKPARKDDFIHPDKASER